MALTPAAARLPGAWRGAVRHLHARHADGGDRPAARATRRPAGARSRTPSAACCAAAPATSRSSRRCWMSPAVARAGQSADGAARPSAPGSPRVDGSAKVDRHRALRRRCGPGRCAVAARRALAACRAPASRSAISTPSCARTPGLVRDPDARGCAGRELVRHLPADEGSAGAGAGLVRFRGEAVLALVGIARAVDGMSDAEPCRSPGSPSRRPSRAMAARWRRGAPAHARHCRRQCADARQSQAGDVRGDGRRRARRPKARSRPASSSTPTSSRRRAMPRRGRRPHRGHGLHAGALHGSRGDRARAGR